MKHLIIFLIIIGLVLIATCYFVWQKSKRIEPFANTVLTYDNQITYYNWIYTNDQLDLTEPNSYPALVAQDGVVYNSIDDKYIVYDYTYSRYNIIFSPTNKLSISPSDFGISFLYDSAISIWLKPYSISKLCPIIGKDVADHFIFQDKSDLIVKIYGTENYNTGNAISIVYVERWSNVFELNTWSHIIISWNGSALTLYKNGVYIKPTLGTQFIKAKFNSILNTDILGSSIYIGGTNNLYFDKTIAADNYSDKVKFPNGVLNYFNGNIMEYKSYNEYIRNVESAAALFNANKNVPQSYVDGGFPINLSGSLTYTPTAPTTTAPTTTAPTTTAPTTTAPTTTAPTTTAPTTSAPTTTAPTTTAPTTTAPTTTAPTTTAPTTTAPTTTKPIITAPNTEPNTISYYSSDTIPPILPAATVKLPSVN